MEDVQLEVIQIRQSGARAPDIRRQGVMHDIGGSMAVLHEERQVGRFTEIRNPAGLLDRGAGELGFHELGIGGVVGFLLGGLRVGQRGDGHAVDGHAVVAIAKGIVVVVGGGLLFGFFRVTPAWSTITITITMNAINILRRILGFGLVLLPFRRGNLALDGKGHAVGTGDAEAGGIAADLALLA